MTLLRQDLVCRVDDKLFLPRRPDVNMPDQSEEADQYSRGVPSNEANPEIIIQELCLPETVRTTY